MTLHQYPIIPCRNHYFNTIIKLAHFYLSLSTGVLVFYSDDYSSSLFNKNISNFSQHSRASVLFIKRGSCQKAITKKENISQQQVLSRVFGKENPNYLIPHHTHQILLVA